MYLKITKNGAKQAYYHLVESYWLDGKSRQRTLLSLGRVGGDGDEKIDEVIAALSKGRDVLTLTQMAKEISVEETFILGPLLILEKMFERIGINEVIKDVAAKHPQLEVDIRKILFTIIASRFVKPGSKLKIFEHWRKILYPEMIDPAMPLHHLYRTLDVLAEHKEGIEHSLYWRERDLLSEATDIVLYDLTTLRFESTKQTEELRRFGFSKEKRSDCTQVVFGLLLNTDGIPLGFEVYPGNTFEGSTLPSMVEKLRKKFRVRRIIFVADRGLFSAKNLETLRADEGEFIVGHKLGTMKKLDQEALYDLDKFQWIIPEELAAYETKTEDGDRLIVTWSRKRAERDAKTRADIIAKIEKKISARKRLTPKAFISNTNYQKFVTGLDKGVAPALNIPAIEAAAKKDGFFGIVTNVKDISARDAVTNYKELWKIEDAFGEIKGTLKARPIFHWTDNRIVGHLVVCFLAYLCEAHITKLLREKNASLKSAAIEKGSIRQRVLTTVESLRELNEVRAVPVKIRGQTIWCRTDITGNAAALFQAVGAPIPAKILKTSSNPAGTK